MATGAIDQVGMDVAAEAYHAVSDIGADFPELLLSLAAERTRRRNGDVVAIEDLKHSAQELIDELRSVCERGDGTLVDFAEGVIELLQRIESR